MGLEAPEIALLFLNHAIPEVAEDEKRTLSPLQNVVAPVTEKRAESWAITRKDLEILSEHPVEDVATNLTTYVPAEV